LSFAGEVIKKVHAIRKSRGTKRARGLFEVNPIATFDLAVGGKATLCESAFNGLYPGKNAVDVLTLEDRNMLGHGCEV
jgi:hypothetical protein